MNYAWQLPEKVSGPAVAALLSAIAADRTATAPHPLQQAEEHLVRLLAVASNTPHLHLTHQDKEDYRMIADFFRAQLTLAPLLLELLQNREGRE